MMKEESKSELCHFGVPPYDEIIYAIFATIIKLDHQCDKVLEQSSGNLGRLMQNLLVLFKNTSANFSTHEFKSKK